MEKSTGDYWLWWCDEVKSGPAFNKVPGSSLVAVMRRDAAKSSDYAKGTRFPNGIVMQMNWSMTRR